MIFVSRAGVVFGAIALLVPLGLAQSALPSGAFPALLVEGNVPIKKRTVPVYPPDLETQNVTGEVTVQQGVEEAGPVRDLHMTKPSDLRSKEAVLTALQTATIGPAVEHSRTVAGRVGLTGNFKPPYRLTKAQLPPESTLPPLRKPLATPDDTPDSPSLDEDIDRPVAVDLLGGWLVEDAGRIAEAKVVTALHPRFAPSALMAVKRWKSRPARQGDGFKAERKRATLNFIDRRPRATVTIPWASRPDGKLRAVGRVLPIDAGTPANLTSFRSRRDKLGGGSKRTSVCASNQFGHPERSVWAAATATTPPVSIPTQRRAAPV